MPVLESYPFGLPMRGGKRPPSVERVESTFHPTIGRYSLILVLVKEFQKKSGIAQPRAATAWRLSPTAVANQSALHGA